MVATEFSKQKTEEDYYERIRDLATKIDWKFVEHIWSINQPLIKMTSGSFKRRGHKKTAGTACIEPGEPEIEEARKCRGFILYLLQHLSLVCLDLQYDLITRRFSKSVPVPFLEKKFSVNLSFSS